MTCWGMCAGTFAAGAAMVLLSEAAFTGAFAYASYKTLGRWIKFTEDTAKRFDGA